MEHIRPIIELAPEDGKIDNDVNQQANSSTDPTRTKMVKTENQRPGNDLIVDVQLNYNVVDWITPEEFDDVVHSFIQKKSEKFQPKALITRETLNDCIQVLQNKHSQVRTPSFRFWARKRFSLRTRGNTFILCSKDIDIDEGKPVCIKEDLYNVLTQAHISCDHKGRDPTYDCVKKSYSYVPKEICDMLVKKCKKCSIKRKKTLPAFPSLPSPVTQKSILTSSFMSNIQVHIIDYSDKPSLGRTCIIYIQDVYSKYIWAYPVKKYTPEVVTKKLNKTFCGFGTPLILQTNCEHITAILSLLADYWPELKTVYAKSKEQRPSNVQQFELLLSSYIKRHNIFEWSKATERVCYHHNTTSINVCGKTPYELVFGKIIRNDSPVWNIITSTTIQSNKPFIEKGELSIENQKILFFDYDGSSL